MTFEEIMAVYRGSNGKETQALYDRLGKIQPLGIVAVNLFRACKTSERAKNYRRGPGHISAAYDRKDWSIGNAADALVALPADPFPWGWAIDDAMRKRGDPHHHVVYFDLPPGQISFHVGSRRAGPDYPGKWDRAIGTAPDRVCTWCASLFAGTAGTVTPAAVEPPSRPEPPPEVYEQQDMFGRG